ncbi:hypothetical protein FRC20_006638 [Serendipita sp. 405]|nr:hypothetical protein FRC15_008283 [Serendipita sp. 397]KAG8766215.1 hypothetical protein FRC16_007743 [Serendipita sp. 398]KAG8837659.1 hypothetical protein FRC20_006638 [Serendipita sp. 405]
MSLKFTVVDAFTSKPFCGNPAAVIVLPENHTLPDSTLQGIAVEFNLSETAYIIQHTDSSPKKGGDGKEYVEFGLRWFTPASEIQLCGHATLASASVLYADSSLVPASVSEIRFSTLSGILKARRINSTPPKVELQFPSGDIEPASTEVEKFARKIVAEAMEGVGVQFVGISRREPYGIYLLIEIDDAVPLKGMMVDSGRLGPPGTQFPIVEICQRTKLEAGVDVQGYDYRVFAFPLGLSEDPVCGSAISFAASYWESKTKSREDIGGDRCVEFTNKIRAVSSRGGEIDAICDGGWVKLRGETRVASRGEIFL